MENKVKLTDQELARRQKLTRLIEKNLNPYVHERFERNFNSNSFKEKYQNFSKEELHENNDEIRIAGRVMALRQTFGKIQDFYGNVQFYLNRKAVSPELFKTFDKLLDIGDIIGIIGSPMKTNTGELTINIKDFVILSKALKPLPEKFHGLQDEETRSRQRYLDLMMNRESLNTFVTRSKIVSYIREYLNNKGYIEVETPVLQSILGGAAARPFITHHNTLDQEYYLRIATEIALKKLVVGGFEKVYEIGRIFRNEGMDSTHNPEFTSLEAYAAYLSMEDIMDEVENIFKYVANKLNLNQITYKGVNIDFTKPFKRINMVDLIKAETGIDFNKITDLKEAQKLAKEHEIEVLKHQNSIGHIVNLFFEKYGECKCLEPTFVYGHPIEVSPLSKIDPKDNRYTKRFELFIATKEYANAFSELNDPIDQYERFKKQLDEKELGNDEANEMDYDFITALEYGLAPTGGLGIGIDRMAMLFTNKESIRDVLLFPHLREINKK